MPNLTRRDLLCAATASTAALAAATTSLPLARAADSPATRPLAKIGLNTSTLRGQKLPLADVVEIAGRAGYQAIEPWIDELDAHHRNGGSLKDLGKRIADFGMTVESAIGFAEWIADDDARRAKGLERAKHDMDLVHQVGGLRLASPPAGATDVRVDPAKATERYRALLKAGEQIGIVPQAEVWGFSKTFTRLSDAAAAALDSGYPAACVLPDVFHLYKGGSDFGGLRLLSGEAVHVIHVNDYPNLPRDKIKDADRVFPGDGVAPLAEVFRDLRDAGFHGTLSIELFNPNYYRQDPKQVARTALEKTRAILADALR
jgi:sugar phosphate isomerase/epimerase